MGVQQSDARRDRSLDARQVTDLNPRFIAVEANVSEANVKRAKASGRSHNEWGFSNRMLDVTEAWMRAK
jgi:glyceraldehyde-3-phosphate dehydrogenase/erythrose-4-phosphate dehydrogenase